MRPRERNRPVLAALGALALVPAVFAGAKDGEEPPPPGPAEGAARTAGPVPEELRKAFDLSPFYQKHVSAGGLPVLSSAKVSDFALLEAAYLLDRMFEHRPDVRQAMIERKARVGILAVTEFTTDIPEHSHMRPKEYADKRARGMGGPRCVSAGEENLLGYRGDPYAAENILIHEFAHGIHEMGLRSAEPSFHRRLRDAHRQAMDAGLWKGAYAATNPGEYWAEGVQSWFDTNRENDAAHNHVDTREELKAYDPNLARLVEEVFGDRPWRYRKPAEREEPGHLAGFDRAAAPTFSWPEHLIEWNRKHAADVERSRRRGEDPPRQDPGDGDTSPSAAVLAAVKKLAEQSSYEWTTEVRSEGGGPFGGGSATTRGRIEKDGYTWISSVTPDGTVELARKGDHVAVVLEGSWMTLEQAAARAPRDRGPRGGGLNRESVSGLKMPLAQVEELLGKAAGFRQDGARVIAELAPDAVNELYAAPPLLGGRGGPRRGSRGALEDPRGTVTFTIESGMLSAYVVEVGGTRRTPGGEEKRTREMKTTFAGAGSTALELPADAREIIDALAAGRAPDVFVPEPGFRKLSSGRDLSGWSGHPGFWSVQDGAITGTVTEGSLAQGSTFLIAQAEGKNLVVDDFELRFSCRIVPGNDSKNAGIQYRSKDLGHFAVEGYQAGIGARHESSGTLHHTATSGGRGILAACGELASWSRDGKKTSTGTLGSPEEIRARIEPGGWNEWVILAQGSRLQHFVNGAQTLGIIDETEGKRLASGILALELPADRPVTVQFKNIRLKALGAPDLAGGAAIKAAKDFTIEMLYTVPRETEGSWVAMCFDPGGRLIVSDQNGSLHRVTLPPAAGGAVQTEKIDLDIGFAHGLLWAFDRLYVAVNEGDRPHGVYSVQDTDGDDRLDRVELLRRVEAGGEHGLHSLVLSPDGRSIHVVIGNQSSLTEMAYSRVPHVWSEDDLLPRLPTGFMDDSRAPQGYIARMDPDGKSWELLAMGFRNPFDAAFNTAGELFTYDADMEWDIGEPWYRPTRVNHVISGAEFGFRNGNGKWPDSYLDSFGAVVDIGPGSPTAVAFGYGARFPAKYQDAFYIADWSFGKLRAVHLKPAGSSYTAEVEDFISGQPFPITDFLVSPADGAMYIAVGGRGAQSALYRVSYTGSESTAPSAPDTRLQERRDLRRRLEALHGRRSPGAVDAVWPYLADPDRAIRHAARVALEWQDPGEWMSRALEEKDARKAIAALVALTRVSSLDETHRKAGASPPDPALRAGILRALDGIAWASLGPADRADLLRAYSLALTRLGRPDDAARAPLIERLDPLFPARTRVENKLLAELLIHMKAPSAAAKVVAALRAAPSQEEQIEYAVALRVLEAGWTMPLREEYFRWFVKAQAYRGGNTFASSLRRAKEQAVALLSAEEKRELQPILDARNDLRSPLAILQSRRKVKEWALDELMPLAERGMKGGRDFERGRKLYSEVACSACHRFANDGGSVGPDLSAVSGRFGLRDLLEAIVEPSRTISDQYEAVIILKKNGEVVTGRIANLGGANVNVVEDMLDPGAMTNVRRSDIASIEPSKVSPMPEGLLDTLHEEEVQDLIAYILSRGDPESLVYQ